MYTYTQVFADVLNVYVYTGVRRRAAVYMYTCILIFVCLFVLCVYSKVRAESVLGDALLCMPPFLGQLANVDIIKVRPKAEVDFLRYKVIFFFSRP